MKTAREKTGIHLIADDPIAIKVAIIAYEAGRQAIIEEVEKKFFRIEPFPSYWVIDEVDWQAIKKQVKA